MCCFGTVVTLHYLIVDGKGDMGGATSSKSSRTRAKTVVNRYTYFAVRSTTPHAGNILLTTIPYVPRLIG